MAEPQDSTYIESIGALVRVPDSKSVEAKLPKQRAPKTQHFTDEGQSIVNVHLEEYETLVSFERRTLQKNLSVAEYLEQDRLIRVCNKKGGHWDYHGHTNNGQTFLHPEEAVYLLECGVMQIFSEGGVPWTIQKAYHTLLSGKDQLSAYQVYANLKRAGYIVQWKHKQSLPDVGGSYLLDVFKPLKSFKKTSQRHPDFVIIVTRPCDSFPSLDTIKRLQDLAPHSELKYAVNSGTEISYYTIYQLTSLPSS